MASKDELQNILKEKYGINKNISQPLSKEECERLLYILSHEPGAVKLVESFAQKNESLGENNRLFGTKRSQAEKKLASLQIKNDALQESIKTLELSNPALEEKRNQLEKEKATLEADIQNLSNQNVKMQKKINELASEKIELVEVNDQLKKDNKALKNIIDKIKFEIVVHLKNAFKSGDIFEIKKTITKLVKWIGG
jgi:chromosome segregation ATPase